MPEFQDHTTAQELAQRYFGLPSGSPWRWAEAGEVLEWHNGDTLCYRAELSALLAGLHEQGLPPLPAALLLLAACADTWSRAGGGDEAIMRQLTGQPADQIAEHFALHLRLHVLGFLATVRGLPASLRTGPARLHLFREVFKAQSPHLLAEWVRPVLDEWNGDRVYLPGTAYLPPFTSQQLRRELSSLSEADARFPTTDELARHLRTGLPQPPAALPALLQLLASVAQRKSAPPPVPPAGDLLEQLAAEPRTAPLARLTRHLLAGLRIPAPAQGAGELPLGGVADLTTRGTLDRLLLSELAHDDLTFTARLANNEALYWRREEPPHPTPPPPVLLLDTTLRLWGTPRVFGLAAALAWAQLAGATRPRRPAPLALAVGGGPAIPLDLRTVAGVLEALALLDPAPHAGAALHALAARPPVAGPAEYVLVTAAELLLLPAFAQALAAVPLPLRHVLAVDRDGTLNLYEWAGGHRQLRSTSRYDLATLLAPAAPLPGRPRPVPPVVPTGELAFWQQQPAPLFLPAVGVRTGGRVAFLHPGLGALAITDTYRLLHWRTRYTSAREVLPAIEVGNYYFGTDESTYLAVLVQAPGQLHAYRLTVATGLVEYTDLSTLPVADAYQKVYFSDGRFWLWQGTQALVVDYRLALISARQEQWSGVPALALPRPQNQTIRQFIQLNYNVLLRVQKLGVSQTGELLLEGHQLEAVAHPGLPTGELRLTSYRTPDTRRRATAGETQPSPANARVVLRGFAWHEGSTAVLDSRGLLHLRSADPAVPELALLLVLNQPTAAWAADGTVCGPTYFTGPAPTRRLGGLDFYRTYFRPFIQQLGSV